MWGGGRGGGWEVREDLNMGYWYFPVPMVTVDWFFPSTYTHTSHSCSYFHTQWDNSPHLTHTLIIYCTSHSILHMSLIDGDDLCIFYSVVSGNPLSGGLYKDLKRGAAHVCSFFSALNLKSQKFEWNKNNKKIGGEKEWIHPWHVFFMWENHNLIWIKKLFLKSRMYLISVDDID